MEVQLLARKIIKPSKPTPLHLHNLKFSLFDQLSPPFYVPIIFYYLSDGAPKSTHHEKFTLLETSLSKALTNFYPFAGRYSNDDLTIHCNDEGVEFVEALVEKDLAEFLNEGPKIELLNQFLAWDDVLPSPLLATSPMLAIQANMFSCGGIVIGIQSSHLVADAFTLEKFINHWACITRTGKQEMSFTVSFGNLASLFPTRILPGSLVPPPSTSNSNKVVTRRFVFDAKAIAILKQRILSKDTTIVPTRVVAVTAVLWKALVSAFLAKNDYLKDFVLFPTINLRERTVLSIPQNTLGNFWICGTALFQANKNGTELHDFAKLMKNAITQTTMKTAKGSIDEISDFLITRNKEIIDNLVSQEKYACWFTSWCKFTLVRG